MSLTDNRREIEKIKEIAEKIYESSETDGVSVRGTAGVTNDITAYRFDTPVELRDCLYAYWEKLGKDYMKPFVPVVTVAAFQNKDNQNDHYETVSPLIYEF